MGRSAQGSEDSHDLVDFAVSIETDLILAKLEKNAAK